MNNKRPNPDVFFTDDEVKKLFGTKRIEAVVGQEKSWTVVDYVREEVTRQGHDITTLDGIERVGWMLDAWSYALRKQYDTYTRPTIKDVIALGKLVERNKNRKGLRTVRVYIKTNTGIKRFPEFEQVPELLDVLFNQIRGNESDLEFYKSFMEIHPFFDGNGRVGKILLAWLSNKLYEPEFPPADLFGVPIRNP
jgi:hypothetical protein